MNLDEFKAEVARHDTTIMKRMVLSISVMFAALAVAGILGSLEIKGAAFIGPAVVFLLGAPLMLYGFQRVDRAYRKFPALICPHCQGSLARSKPIVIATGNCPHCGREVVTDAAIGT